MLWWWFNMDIRKLMDDVNDTWCHCRAFQGYGWSSCWSPWVRRLFRFQVPFAAPRISWMQLWHQRVFRQGTRHVPRRPWQRRKNSKSKVAVSQRWHILLSLSLTHSLSLILHVRSLFQENVFTSSFYDLLKTRWALFPTWSRCKPADAATHPCCDGVDRHSARSTLPQSPGLATQTPLRTCTFIAHWTPRRMRRRNRMKEGDGVVRHTIYEYKGGGCSLLTYTPPIPT